MMKRRWLQGSIATLAPLAIFASLASPQPASAFTAAAPKKYQVTVTFETFTNTYRAENEAEIYGYSGAHGRDYSPGSTDDPLPYLVIRPTPYKLNGYLGEELTYFDHFNECWSSAKDACKAGPNGADGSTGAGHMNKTTFTVEAGEDVLIDAKYMDEDWPDADDNFCTINTFFNSKQAFGYQGGTVAQYTENPNVNSDDEANCTIKWSATGIPLK
ncbi:hypothetical protein [Streptomyces sp. NPDC048508]|uniref:hypothetical protein n=1 Tax=Streptomyces sp. NPDC048508 TaxID=3365561 RepID=UPI00371EFF9E